MSIEEIIKNAEKEFISENSYANIMVLGETGAGKSSLINLIFGDDLAKISHDTPQTQEFNIYLGKKHNQYINIIDSKGYELTNGVDAFVNGVKNYQTKLKNGEISGCEGDIHVIWYCIDCSTSRVQDFDIQAINLLKKNYKHVFVVMTKCDQDDEYFSTKKAYESVLDTKIYAVSNNEKVLAYTDIEQLVSDSASSITNDDIRRAFISSQKRNLTLKEEEAHKIILGYTAGCAAAGANPIPFMSDTMIITPAQVSMLYRIGNIYGVNLGKATLESLVAETIAKNLGKALASNLVKMFPGVGSIIGGIINVGVAGTITYAMGFGYSKFCKSEYDNILNGRATSLNAVEDILSTMQYYAKNTKWDDIKKEVKNVESIKG